jgi:hypothetical protein
MVLASGQIVDTIRQFGAIEADFATSDVMVVGNILHSLVNTISKSSAEAKTTIAKENFIRDQIGYLQWAGIEIRSRDKGCILRFFKLAIIPILLHYNIDLQFIVDNSLNCSSCAETNTIHRQQWEFLSLKKTSVEDVLGDVLADLFGQTLQKKVCPRCSDEGLHYTSLSIINCPKHLFVYCEPTEAIEQNVFKLTPHVDIYKIISSNITFTRSYSRYTLQSFITFYKKNDVHHYFTFARQKEDWFCLDDMNVKVVSSSSLFQNPAKCQPIVLAHYIRPSETDVFSVALFNVFTNFSQQKPTLPSTLSLNAAASYFAQNNPLGHNSLNLVVIKRLSCASCKRGM